MNISKEDFIEVLNANTSFQWEDEDVTSKMLADYNTEFNLFLKIHPKYDPLDLEDYRGEEDDDFIALLNKVLLENDRKKEMIKNESVVGESLIIDGWPVEYKGKKFDSHECEIALDEHFAEQSWEAAKAIINKFPSRIVRSASSKNMSWAQFKDHVKPHISKLAAFCLGPELNGDITCWKGRNDGPIGAVRNMIIKDLPNHIQITNSIMEAISKKCPMSSAIKFAMTKEVVPNLHLRVINESNLELDAGEFADIAAALNSTAQSLADIVHGFISKAFSRKDTSKSDDALSGDENHEISVSYEECLDGGMNTDDAVAKCAELYNLPDAKIREILTSLNVNMGSAASTNAEIEATATAPADNTNTNSDTVADTAELTAKKARLTKLYSENPKDEDIKKQLNDVLTALGEKTIDETVGQKSPFSLSVNKQYQTASGQVLTLRKMTAGQNPQLVFEDDQTGDRVELYHDKFMKLNPTEIDISNTKVRKSLINKFKKRINLLAMKTNTRVIFKSKTGRKIYESLDSIKSGGRPVGDIAGIVIGTSSNSEKNNEFSPGDTVKAGQVEGEIQGFQMNESEGEPEIIVKTPDGEEVSITVSDFEESEPVHVDMEEEETDPSLVGEHVEYKGFSLLQNVEDDSWSVLQGDEKISEEPVSSMEDAKAWVDAKLDEEGEGSEENGEEEPADASESISRRFIKESKNGSIKLKTFSEVLSETKNPALKKNLVRKKPPIISRKK